MDKKEIQYIQASQTEIQFFSYQLLQHLLNNVIGKPPQAPAKQSNDTQDRILRAHEVQKMVDVSRSTIWRMERKGQSN